MSTFLLKCTNADLSVELTSKGGFGIHITGTVAQPQATIVIPYRGTYQLTLDGDSCHALGLWLADVGLLGCMSIQYNALIAPAHGPINPSNCLPLAPQPAVKVKPKDIPRENLECLGMLIAQSRNISEALVARQLIAVERDKRENADKPGEQHKTPHTIYWDYQIEQFDMLMADVRRVMKEGV
jgi:hypothetical protein